MSDASPSLSSKLAKCEMKLAVAHDKHAADAAVFLACDRERAALVGRVAELERDLERTRTIARDEISGSCRMREAAERERDEVNEVIRRSVLGGHIPGCDALDFDPAVGEAGRKPCNCAVGRRAGGGEALAAPHPMMPAGGDSVFLANLHHAFAQTDGTYAFPKGLVGDLLRQAKKEIEARKEGTRHG